MGEGAVCSATWLSTPFAAQARQARQTLSVYFQAARACGTAARQVESGPSCLLLEIIDSSLTGLRCAAPPHATAPPSSSGSRSASVRPGLCDRRLCRGNPAAGPKHARSVSLPGFRRQRGQKSLATPDTRGRAASSRLPSTIGTGVTTTTTTTQRASQRGRGLLRTHSLSLLATCHARRQHAQHFTVSTSAVLEAPSWHAPPVSTRATPDKGP